MNQNQTNTLNMYKAVMQVINTFNSVWSLNAVVSAIITALLAAITQLDAADQAQKTDSKGATQAKNLAKTTMFNLALIHASAGRAYAVSVNNTELKAACNTNKTKLERAKDTDADDICQ